MTSEQARKAWKNWLADECIAHGEDGEPLAPCVSSFYRYMERQNRPVPYGLLDNDELREDIRQHTETEIIGGER